MRLCGDGNVEEALILATCNRTEFYLFGNGSVTETGESPVHSQDEAVVPVVPGDRCAVAGAIGAPGAAGAGVTGAMQELARHAGMTLGEAGQYLYAYSGRNAVRHLFRVAAGLDSMVLGEAEILGQVRDVCRRATEEARTGRTVGPMLTRLFQGAVAAGKRVRSETAFGTGAASVPGAAVELARQVFGRLDGRRALVLGAGDMSQLALESLASGGVEDLLVASRSAGRAHELAAQVAGKAIRFEEISAVLPRIDMMVTATASPHPVVTRSLVESALRQAERAGPLFIIDIALPRDVETSVGQMENVLLYNIDDLRQIVDRNLERRRREVPQVESVVAEAVDEFWAWHDALAVVPVIRTFRAQAEKLRQAEVERALNKLDHLSPQDREVVEELARRLLKKYLHGPTSRLRAAANNGAARGVLAAAEYLLLEGRGQSQGGGVDPGVEDE